MTPTPWPWCPRDLTFKPSYQRSDATQFGSQMHEYASPYWMCDLVMPPANNEADRRAFEQVIHSNDGRGLFSVFDRRCPYPRYWRNIVGNGVNAQSVIPDITVTEISKSNSSLTIQGQAEDRVKYGDPIGFTYNNRRYYFKALTDLVLDGNEQELSVFIRPRITASGLSILAERIKPQCYFNVNVNDMEGQTALQSTPISLIGTEYWGEVS